jgi:hypothetical protein
LDKKVSLSKWYAIVHIEKDKDILPKTEKKLDRCWYKVIFNRQWRQKDRAPKTSEQISEENKKIAQEHVKEEEGMKEQGKAGKEICNRV